MDVWFNPSCSKCRIAKEMLDEAGADYTLRRYLDEPPTAEELDVTLAKLGLQPWDITRMNEPIAKQLDLANLEKTREKWLAVLITHPILIQRPIIVTEDGRAVIGRSEDAVRKIIGA
ncbi:MAG: arsenate reductase family protein [Actinomycetota bacterium]